MYEVVTPAMRATATGVSNCSNCIFGGLGALLGGLLQQHLGLQACVGTVSLLLALVLLPLALCYFRLFDRDASRSASRALAFQPPEVDREANPTVSARSRPVTVARKGPIER
jgi:hypothetical protein